MLNYQFDEYMESVVGPYFKHKLSLARAMVDRICYVQVKNQNVKSDGSYKHNGGKRIETVPGLETSTNDEFHIEMAITNYAKHILSYPRVLQSSPSVQQQLCQDLSTFLHAHITQLADNEN